MRVTIILGIISVLACTNGPQISNRKGEDIDPEAKKYWYSGKAEISSYQLSQARYGELHNGKAVLVFVTEPFSTRTNTKADRPQKEDTSVMKLNFTKKFNTGVYPYSMMTSTFYPFEDGKHSFKISSSSQEWCGHTYMEMTNSDQLEFDVRSYFQDEGQFKKKLNKSLLEDDLWTKIRLNPNTLPKGELEVIPSFFYLRLMHKELKAYTCQLDHQKLDGNTAQLNLNYSELERQLSIQYETDFPYRILAWQESYYSGWGAKRQKLTSKAQLIKTIQSDYWNKNSNIDSGLRSELGLD